MTISEKFNLWMLKATDDLDLTTELDSIKGNQDEIYERFYKDLEFGTAGLRGIIGAGCNRINIYTIRLATQGLANYINKNFIKGKVAISFDSRNKSELFAHEAARVLGANGIKVYITKELQPTPVLSFATREFDCSAGIMITASHNKAEYNGYKCYGEDGCQMTGHLTSLIFDEMRNLDCFKDVIIRDFSSLYENKMIEFIEESFYDKYIEEVMKQQINNNPEKEKIKIVYTPLNGAGNKLVRRVLHDIMGYDVKVVKEQETPDGNFPTCTYPNPEVKSTLKLAVELAEKFGADVVLGTDPDCDRVGIAVKDKTSKTFRLMTGNEVGILLTYYILSQKKSKRMLPSDPIIISTIVSSPMVKKIVEDYDGEMRTVLTGFKYIGDQILSLEKSNQEHRFLFGFEESYGYLAGTYVRDKDAVVASMLICEMICYYKGLGITILDVLEDLYKRYGFYKSNTISFSFEGSKGYEKMSSIMARLRENLPNKIGNVDVTDVIDYASDIEKTGLPKANILSLQLKDGSIVIIRPSGTEPKIKVYMTVVSSNEEDANKFSDTLIKSLDYILCDQK